MICETHPFWAEDYTHDELKKKNVPEVSNRLKELIDTNATLYSNKEPVELGTYNSKTSDGWREKNITCTPENTGHE